MYFNVIKHQKWGFVILLWFALSCGKIPLKIQSHSTVGSVERVEIFRKCTGKTAIKYDFGQLIFLMYVCMHNLPTSSYIIISLLKY